MMKNYDLRSTTGSYTKPTNLFSIIVQVGLRHTMYKQAIETLRLSTHEPPLHNLNLENNLDVQKNFKIGRIMIGGIPTLWESLGFPLTHLTTTHNSPTQFKSTLLRPFSPRYDINKWMKEYDWDQEQAYLSTFLIIAPSGAPIINMTKQA